MNENTERPATRCKFRCETVIKSKNWRWTPEKPYIYTAKFFAVHDGSPENEAFFQATPSGSLEIGVYTDDRFVVGREYYIDVSLAADETAKGKP